MKNKIKYWIGIIGTKNLIAISSLLVLVVAVSAGIAISNNNTKKQEQASRRKCR